MKIGALIGVKPLRTAHLLEVKFEEGPVVRAELLEKLAVLERVR